MLLEASSGQPSETEGLVVGVAFSSKFVFFTGLKWVTALLKPGLDRLSDVEVNDCLTPCSPPPRRGAVKATTAYNYN